MNTENKCHICGTGSKVGLWIETCQDCYKKQLTVERVLATLKKMSGPGEDMHIDLASDGLIGLFDQMSDCEFGYRLESIDNLLELVEIVEAEK